MFTYSQLKTSVNNRMHNKMGRITDIRTCLNDGVRNCVGFPLNTLKRKYVTPIRMLDDIFDYAAPSDIQGHKVIDLTPVTAERSFRYQWSNVHAEVFDRMRSIGKPVLCVTSNGSSRVLKAAVADDALKVMLSEMDSITDGGTWAAVGTASDLETDSTTYLYGSGSIKFDIGAGTQDGIDVTLDASVDILSQISDGSIYVSASLPSVTGVTGITVQVGSDSSNYIECSATSDIAGNSLTSGWNLFRLKLSDGTETGSPDYENLDYISLLVDKDATPLTGVRFDRIMVGTGSQHFLSYYSRYGWRTSAGTWQDASTADTDILNAEEEEYQMIVESCVEQCALSAREEKDAMYSVKKLIMMKKDYLMKNPDTSLPLESDKWLRSN